MSSPKTKRTRFSIAKKVELLNLLKKGKGRKEVCQLYSVSPSTLFTFVKDELKIREEFENNRDPNRKVIKKSPFHELELSLTKWIHIVRERKIALNGPMVQEKALEFAKALRVTDF